MDQRPFNRYLPLEFSKNYKQWSFVSGVTIVLLILFTIIFVNLGIINGKMDQINNDDDGIMDEIKKLKVQIYDCTLIGTRCFSVYADRDKTQLKTQSNAFDYCRSRGGRMAEFSENNIDFMEFKRAFPQIHDGYDYRLWVDARDHIKEGNWIWGSGKLLSLVDPRWRRTQPDEKKNANCLIYVYYRDDSWNGFADYPCDSNNGVICEYII